MAKSFRERIGDLLDLVRGPLAEYGIDRLKARYGEDWQEGALDALGRDRHGHTVDDPREWDIQAWFNFYIGSWSSFFAEILNPGDRSRLFDLKEYRNEWAHQGNFDFDRTYRAYDSAQQFLESINSPVAATVAQQKEDLQREKFSRPSKKTVVRIKSNPQGALKPWRAVAVPHEDVQKGTFSSSEFAADLWEVHKAVQGDSGARVSKEYRDPYTFFGRTYITEGLGSLLRAGLKRLNGSGGEPVIQLQTNFGGGKTHSMLALYHLTGGDVAAQDLPGVDQFLSAEGLSVPKAVRRAVIVGNKIQPGSVSRKPDGTETRTIWGEIAWQLGGKSGYEMVRTADEQATSPGDALTNLLKRFAPAVILIDEWVAYARQLYNRQDLKACGSFDTQFTFAQTLTEAAKIAQGVVIVISLPQSDAELGSEAGKETLERLRTVVGRVESTWQPATRSEAFEIVRRRLFETSMDTVARGGTVRAYEELYRNNAGHFPPRVREAEYLRQLEQTYPIHPDLFDSLYKTWSVIPGFQQTRGVLRLMAAVIHRLWDGGDTGLMIMPGMVPLDDSIVRTEFTKFLTPGWNNIIDAEIDGQDSIAAQTDRENSALGALGAARRAARTLFLATSPLEKASQPGIDERALKTGCVQPGEKPAVFGDAVGYLAARSVYLYGENDRYWYSEQPTLRRLAEDRKASLERSDILAALEEILARPPHQEKGDFARLHVAPRSPADVADEDRVALVVLPPGDSHSRGDTDSAALAAARTILDSRGAAPRINKNMVVFAAADTVRLEELLDAVGSWITWKGIVDQIDGNHASMENVTRGQADSARAEMERSRTLVDSRVPETYRWMLLPSQKSTAEPIGIVEHQLTGDRPVGLKATHFLANKQWLMAQMDGPALRVEMDHVPLWSSGGYVSVGALCEYFARYPYLPRISSPDTVIEAVRDGVASLTWNPQTFAWAESVDEATGRFTGLLAGEQIPRDRLAGGIVVTPEIAERQLDAEAKDAPGTAAAESGTNADGHGGQGDVADTAESAAGSGATPTSPSAPAQRRFFGSVTLDPQRASTQMGTILEEVLSHLNATGATVKVSLDIEAHLDVGFPDQIRRVVTQNTADLKFDQAGFEEE